MIELKVSVEEVHVSACNFENAIRGLLRAMKNLEYSKDVVKWLFNYTINDELSEWEDEVQE